MLAAMSSPASSSGLTYIVALLLCVFRSSLSQIDLDCLSGWEIRGHHCYKVFPNSIPWMSAERTCVGYGGNLATPFDYYENEDIGQFVNDKGVNQFWIVRGEVVIPREIPDMPGRTGHEVISNPSIWSVLGADRIGAPPNDNRVLRYSGGLETLMWVGYWSIYQPNFSDGDCVYVTKDRNQFHKWSFGPCEMNMAFLCQRSVCAQGSFHCVNGNCASPKGRCDGLDDCGDRSDETDCPENCSSYIRTSGQGVITYPSSGSNYPNNADCSWFIEADIGYNVQLAVTTLSLENNSDELIVMDGGLTESSSMEIVRLTGQPTVPKYFYSSDNKMLIKFRSDGSDSGTGFSLTYTQVSSGGPSQNMLNATSMWQVKDFPYYGSYLLGNQDISYIIEAQDTRQIVTIEILDIDLPGDATVLVRNGDKVTDSVLETYTGTYKGSGIVVSTGRYLYIALHTVRGSQHRGLQIRYIQGCGGSTNQSTGFVSSPSYPVSFYPNGVTCRWDVTIPEAKNVTILLPRVDVDSSDRIQIMEGNAVIGNYSGNSVPNSLRITGGQFSVVFTSSATLNGQGFNLTYSVDCPTPMIDLSISEITGTLSESYGSLFKVSCKQGSQFTQAEHINKTDVTMICLAYGRWNVNTSPKCERIRCQNAPALLNGYIASSTGNLMYNGTVTYKCYQGFQLLGSETVTCDAAGKWVNLPSCQASACGMAPKPDPNGSQQITVGNGTSYGSILRYSCNQGYDLIGEPTLFCDSNGVWVGKEAGTCKILTCYTSNIPNGVFSSNRAEVGLQVMLTCNTGYRSVTGETSMTCNSNRTFTPMLSCQNINECDNNSTCQHQCVDTDGSYNCNCNPGFQVNGPLCTDINECMPVSPCDGTCTNTEGSYQCSCDDGFSLFVANGTQGHFIPSTEDGTQPGDVYRLNHSCVPNICQAPPSIANTNLLSQKASYYYNDTVMYKCQLGYILENAMVDSLHCNQSGNWAGVEVKCSSAMCDVDQVPNNLINPGNVSLHNNMSINFGEEIQITCNVPGFTPQMFSRTRRCTLIGKDYRLDGSVNDYECGFISCGVPQNEPGSNYTDLSTYYYSSNFIFGCQPAFKLDGVSVMTRNNTVTCQDNGQWDFGNLSCTGIQCLDPGQPYLGQQVSSDYREGQLVNFACLISGYTLSPSYPISCAMIQNGTARFNGSLPMCVDTQRPVITNCPQYEIIVARNTSVGSAFPELQFQDNGGIKRLSVVPAWPPSQYYIKSTQIFNFTFTDYENNQAACEVSLRRKDDITPTIVCPTPRTYVFRSENDSIIVDFLPTMVTVNDDVTPAAQLKVTFSLTNLTFDPKSMSSELFPLRHYVVVQAFVQDAAGNSDSCTFGLYFLPDVCSPYYIRTPPNSNKACTAVGQGYSCTITCNPGFNLYNNVSKNSISKSCSGPGIAFQAEPDVKCVNLTSLDGSYKLVYDFTYEGKNVTNSCKASYESIIKDTLKVMTENRTVIPNGFCNTATVNVQGNITLGSLSVKEAEKMVLVQYVINFERRSGSRYSDCADSVKLLMGKPESYLVNLLVYRPLQCENITLTSNHSLVYQGYYCEDGNRQLMSSIDQQSISYCLPCPEGTYSNGSMCTPCLQGTYGDMPNMDMCLSCQNNTSTYSSGAVSSKECASQCAPGDTSANGLPPCYLCPVNMYWANATTCLDCPPGTVTRGNGSKSKDDCLVPCLPGTFNEIDGHGDCMGCTMHHYSNKSAAQMCLECAPDEYTISSSKNSSADCLKLSVTQCTCQHGNCTLNLPHVWSCVCDDGWFGETCSKSFDPCDSHPCYNGGSCNSNQTSYTCGCPAGTSGKNCEEIIKTCTSNSCQNNGMCQNLVNRLQCHCLSGFTGDRCQTVQDICASQPCKNGGNCTSQGNIQFSCTCPAGITGRTCEDSKDECYTRPCRNNGICQDGNMMPTCDCGMNSSYTGQICDVRTKLCSSANCGPGAICVENEINSTYICICNEYTELTNLSSGDMTCQARNFCARNPCMNNGSCVSSVSSFTCICPVGFGGSMCQNNINDCLSMPCENGGHCRDLVGTFECNCSGTGFQGGKCNIPVNDCASQPCNATGMSSCQDLVNAYQCSCKTGYTGKNCETDINECDSQPCLHNATCVNMVNDYMCQCPEGWIDQNCENENKLCTPTTCLNGAICYDYFNGYYCQCQPNTYEKNCSASANVCQVANPCVHGKCLDRNGNIECICDNGYIGDQCEIQQNFCSANLSVCKNGGQCIPQLDTYECQCQQGYLSRDCSSIVDYCTNNQCPGGSTCYGMEDKAYCRCPLNKEGPSCNKGWDQDFDLLFDHQHKIGMAYLPYPIKLNTPSFSISLWLQFGTKGGTGTFLSVLTVPKPNSLRDKQLLLWIDEKAVHYSSNGTVVEVANFIRYNNDGDWHYLVVNVDRKTGVLHLIVDTINSDPVSIPANGNGTFDDNIWLVLGAMYDTGTNMPVRDMGFYGKLSKVTIYSRELLLRDEVTILGNRNTSALFSDSIHRWNSELKYSTGVIRKTPSEADKSCPFGNTGYPTCNISLPGKKKVTIASGQCPNDILQLSPNRLIQISWSVPTFVGQDSQISNYTSEDTFVWGKYQVVIQASNADGNSALCLFNIYIQNDNCTNPQKPPLAQELQCSPVVYENYKQCGLTCQNKTAPSIPSPRIHTCGPVGNWDPEKKFVPYRITPCGAITSPMHQLMINLRYAVASQECTAVTETLEREALKTQVNLNNQWDRVCAQTNCNDTIIEVRCLNSRRKRQATSPSGLNLEMVLTLNNIMEYVVSRSDSSTKRTEDLYRDLILALSPANPFDYSGLVSDAVPTLNSINNIQMCSPPKVLQQNECVDCGPGTFYNRTDKECQFCPIGTYQPSSAQTNCTPCPPATTTLTVGSYNYNGNDCYTECPVGQYMNLMGSPPMCTNCSRGLYQPKSGQFSCLSCPPDKTTKYTGTVSPSDCSNDCPAGQEIGTSNNCTVCRIGFYRGPNDAVCQKCPTGTVTQNTSRTSVSDCNVADNPPGTLRRPGDPIHSDECPVGTYQNDKWQYDCIQCGTSYSTVHEGSTNVSDCKFICPAGQEKKPNEDSCMPCEIAYYHDGSNPFDRCEACPSLYIALSNGSTSKDNCTLYRCSAGQQPNTSNNACEPCPKGTYQEFPDMPNCEPCSQGKSTTNPGASKQYQCESYCLSGEENNGSLCQKCPIGYFKDNSEDVFGNCTRCKNSNYVTADVGSISETNCTILNCQEGYKSNLTTQSCEPCPRGTYQDMKYQESCKSCNVSLYTRHTNSTRQEDCEDYCNSGYEKSVNGCIECPRGWYKDNNVDVFMTCTACDSRYVTPVGPPATNASKCNVRNCQAGSYINGDNCTPCARGTYQDMPWQMNCTQCGTNRSTENEGATSSHMCLLNCSAGYENNGVNTTCDACKIGYYKDIEAAAECTPCANFSNNDIRITTVSGSTSIFNCTKLVCLAGCYPVNDKCTLCDFGTYQPERWNDICDNCPAGNTTYRRGAVSASDCEFNCGLGQELVNGTCRKCDIGFYNDKSNPERKKCFPCLGDKITLQEGSTSDTQCNITDCSTLGQYRDPKDNTCKNCPMGTYQDSIRQDSCKSCAFGSTTKSEKSTSIGDCKKDCPSGYYLNDSSNTCEPCSIGFYRNKTYGNWDCVNCSSDLTTETIASVSASNCSVATCKRGFAYDTATGLCTACPMNTYASTTGMFWPCKSCPNNFVTDGNATMFPSGCHDPCSSGNICNIVTEVCVNDQSSIRCDCKSDYHRQNDQCIHKCEIPNYCGTKGVCVRFPFECTCRPGYTGVLCDIRPDAASLSEQETETTLIAAVTSLSALLFIILLIVCIFRIVKRRRLAKSPRTSDIDEHTSVATRSMKGNDDYPAFAINPAFSSKQPSIFGGRRNSALSAQGHHLYNNPTYSGDENSDPAVYRA